MEFQQNYHFNIVSVPPLCWGGQLSVPNFENRVWKKNESLGILNEFLPVLKITAGQWSSTIATGIVTTEMLY